MNDDRTGADGAVKRIAMITYAADVALFGAQLDMAQRQLSRLGYRDGETAEIRRYFGNRDAALTAAHARDVVAWPADVVLSFMTNADLAMIEATRETPVPIVCWSMDPVGAGLIASAANPGGNLTAVSFAPGYEMMQLRALRALIPGLETVGYLYNLTYAPAASARRKMHIAAHMLRLAIVERECVDATSLKADVAALAKSGAQAIVLGPHELMNLNGGRIATAALTHAIPSIGGDPFGTYDHAITFAPDFERVWEMAATMADRILQGENPAQMPVARCIKPLMAVKMPVLARLGIDAPDWLLEESDTVVR